MENIEDEFILNISDLILDFKLESLINNYYNDKFIANI